MNFRLIVSVEEGIKTLIEPKVPKIDDCITFEDLYNKVTPNTVGQRNIEIYGRTNAKSKWIQIEECFDDELEVVMSLKFTEIKFKISPSSPIPHVLQVNPLDIIMQSARQSQLLSLQRPENSRLDMLYNELIILFERKMLAGRVVCIIVLGKYSWND